jgi:hypothetical protein
MAGHRVFLSSPTPTFPRHLPLPLTGQIQTQAMSHAKFVFLIALVIFFIVLFVAAYVWMRRPDFGQKGGRRIPTAPDGAVARAAGHVPSRPRTDCDAVPMDTPSMPEGH